MDVSIKGSSHTQAEDLHSATPYDHEPTDFNTTETDRRKRYLPPHTVNEIPDVGPVDDYADRDYDDGFVYQDMFTGGAFFPNSTWYWGFDSLSQYSKAADQLSFHAYGSESYGEKVYGDGLKVGYGERLSLCTERSSAIDYDDTVDAWGAGVKIGYDFASEEAMSISLVLGAEAAWDAKTDMSTSTYKEMVTKEAYQVTKTYTYSYWEFYEQESIVVDSYDLNGLVPDPSYEGTYGFPPGPIIPNLPSARSEDMGEAEMVKRTEKAYSPEVVSSHVTDTTTWMAQNQVDIDFSADVYTFHLGPRFAVQASDAISFFVDPSMTLTLTSIDAKRSEKFYATYADGSKETIKTWRDTDDQDKAQVGARIAAGAALEFGNGFFMTVEGGYDWVPEKIDIDLGPNTVKFDPSAYHAELALGFRFGEETTQVDDPALALAND
jgi:hypothetical protein